MNSRKHLGRTLVVSLGIVLVLLGALAVIGEASRWPTVESPPRQGEALDDEALAEKRIVHSSRALARLVREPQNTWSNLAFIFGGAYLATATFSGSARLLGIALVAVGVGSFLYHASASRTLRHLDVGAMYWLFVTTLLFALGSVARNFRGKLERHLATIALGTLVLAAGVTASRNLSIAGFKPMSLALATVVTAAGLILALIATSLRRREARTLRQTAGTIALFAVAVVCQVGDRPGGWLCDPNALVQGHALWHVFSAAAFVSAVYALESERSDRNQIESAGSSC